MNKILSLTLTILFFASLSITTSAQNNPTLQLRPLPVTINPPSQPGQPTNPVPAPNPVIPTNPGGGSTPGTPFNPHEPNIDRCRAITVVVDKERLTADERNRIVRAYQTGGNAEADRVKLEIIQSNSSYFDFTYLRPEYILNNRDFYLTQLKNSNPSKYSKLEDDLKTPAGRQAVFKAVEDIARIFANTTNTPFNQSTMNNLGLANLNANNIDALYLYYGITRIVDYTAKNYSEDRNYSAGVGVPVYYVAGRATKIIQDNGWPNIPQMLVSLSSKVRNDITYGWMNYPGSDNWRDAYVDIGCMDVVPITIIAGTPLIYLYPESEKEVINIKLPLNSLTFSNFPYSPLTGFSLVATNKGEIESQGLIKNYLFYEFDKEKIISSKEELVGQVILSRGELENYLFEVLLKKLSLTKTEEMDYIEDIKKSLSSLNTEKTYIVKLFQSKSLNSLIPLVVTPKPDTVLRNMIVLEELEEIGEISEFMIPENIFRTGFTLVENGFYIDKVKE